MTRKEKQLVTGAVKKTKIDKYVKMVLADPFRDWSIYSNKLGIEERKIFFEAEAIAYKTINGDVYDN